jgi:hypothetical protein
MVSDSNDKATPTINKAMIAFPSAQKKGPGQLIGVVGEFPLQERSRIFQSQKDDPHTRAVFR